MSLSKNVDELIADIKNPEHSQPIFGWSEAEEVCHSRGGMASYADARSGSRNLYYGT